ncbi:MAG: hypothetical protein E3J86_10310 [Candidatus Thorarchaeota archaeon]|nr:MAG: hypothetical protein E3J86_10310 [Candidatus Thorarchaeota archaeon]
MKLFYRVSPDEYRACLDEIREKFGMLEEVDEARTMLLLDDDSQIERVIGTFDPVTDEIAQVRVVLTDESLKEFFDSVLGEPYKVK